MAPAPATERVGHTPALTPRGAFTLIELLVVLFIMALLLSILAPALVSARNETRSFVCMDHMRASAFEFRLFAEPFTCADRGQSDGFYGPRFSAMDFQESLYETCEFWSLPGAVTWKREEYRRGQKPIICPSAPQGLARVHGEAVSSLTQGGVVPKDRVCYAMNRRLIWAPAKVGDSVLVDCFVTISDRILDHPYVPLMFDVDAERAVGVHQEPFFSAPPSRHGEESVYDHDRYWFPARRHNGRMSVGFVGGHVISTSDPLADMSWDWEYHPDLGADPRDNFASEFNEPNDPFHDPHRRRSPLLR